MNMRRESMEEVLEEEEMSLSLKNKGKSTFKRKR